jgi:hypothetical protein
MSLAAKTVHVPAGLGINEGVEPAWIDSQANALRSENVRSPRRNVLGKRYGFTSLTNFRFDDTEPTTGYKLVPDGRGTIRIVDEKAEVLPTLGGLNAWKSIGRACEVGTRLFDVVALGYPNHYLSDACGTAAGAIAVTWLKDAGTASDTVAAVVDQATQTILSHPTVVGTASVTTAPLLAVIGDSVILIRHNTGNTINAWKLDTASTAGIEAGWVAVGFSIATDASSSANLAVLSLGASIVVAYMNTSGGTDRLSAVRFDLSSVIDSITINTSSTDPTSIGVAGSSSDTVWIAWNETTNVRIRGVSPTNLATTLASTATAMATSLTSGLVAVAAPTTAGACRVLANDDGAGLPTMVMIDVTTSAGASTPDAGGQWAVPLAWAAGTPWVRNGRCYVPVVCDSDNSQTTVVYVDWTENDTYVRPIANPAPGLSTTSLIGKQQAFAIGSKWYSALTLTRSSTGKGCALVEFDYGDTRRWGSARSGGSTYLSGGMLTYSDGTRLAEAGFVFRPLEVAAADSGAGSGPNGSYRYAATFEEVDAAGNWHVSGVSDPTDPAVTVVDNTISVTVIPIGVTARHVSGDVQTTRIAIYRTLAGGEPPYYRLTTILNDASGAAALTYSDSITDANLAANAKLYAQPGVLGTAQDRRAPPGLNIITEYQGMIVGAAGRDLWYSGQPVSGEGAWFNPIFVVTFPDDITGLAVMDGVLIVFARRAVYAVAGEPPSDNAASGGLGAPQRLASDVGCIEARSVVATTAGVFFQSERGIELLDRSRAVGWIGEAVSTTLDSYPVVTAATLDAASTCVLFECAASESSGVASGNGRTLVFDLSLQTWISVDRRKNSAGTADSPAQSAGIIYTTSGYRYAWMGTNGRVYAENRSSWLDPGSAWVTALWETADVKMGLQQQQQVFAAMLLGERMTAAELLVEVAYDGANYADADSRAWPEAESDLEQFEFRPRGTNRSVRFRVSDAAPATVGTGRGFEWVGLSIDVAQQGGATRNLPHLATSGRK